MRSEKEEHLKLLEESRNREIMRDFKKFCGNVPIPLAPVNEPEEHICGYEEKDTLECKVCDKEEYYSEMVTLAQHHNIICGALEAATKPEGVKNIIIMMPPGSAKSTYGNVAFAPWFMAKFPRSNVISTTYNSTFAAKNGRKSRELCASNEFEQISGCKLSRDNKAILDWSLDNGSTYLGGGIQSGITGSRADLLIIDDPMKNRAEAQSDIIRDKVWSEYSATLISRLKPNAIKVIIMTRWHESDLVGNILPSDWNGEAGIVRDRKDAEDWLIVRIPARCDSSKDILGRKVGQMLWTEWFSGDFWDIVEKTMTAQDWASLYQQIPSPEEGNIVRRDWLIYRSEMPRVYDCIIHSWDTANKAEINHDFTACCVIGVRAEGYYLIDVVNVREEYPDLKDRIRRMAERDNPRFILIEDKASGTQLIQDLSGSTKLPIKGIIPTRDKITRLSTCSDVISTGNLILDYNAKWCDKLTDELCSFPNIEHKDTVDSLSQALNWLKLYGDSCKSSVKTWVKG